MVSDTESVDGINGNVHSKTETSFLEASSLPLSRMSSEKLNIPTSSTSQATTRHGNISGIKELYLESVYKKDVAHEFYCPNCNSCIQKVIIRGNEPAPNLEQFKCSSCFSFVIPIGNWLFRDSVSKGEDKGPEAVPDIEILVDSAEGTAGYELKGSKKLEIVKSIVYGGLIESITSLSVVTSAASADAATSSIIALSLANLIGGIFTIAHNLSDLKSEQPREASSLANEQVDRYQELLGRRENFLIHATIALLSFLVFGLVPPAVYGFTFMETDDKNLMLAAVAVASLLCITILAIGKAYIQKPPKNHFKIVLSYVATGIVASGVSYVAGDLAKKLMEKLGWFEPGKAVPLSLAEMSSGRLAWASY
ncbi:GLYCINE-RICH PROTEIN FAMILY [Salix koriyanagi]|uniref:GLYCINE-RICH PROTEIN FAMILY n=1 Tax=Salix koriyanagi TaxID=2511006 RepID=A0A9Q0T5Q7_9ROSI|nr:GLYCINE-RICH PROTEIN FAMILY [Salix koriyanagi]